jgi:hypothetical protein
MKKIVLITILVASIVIAFSQTKENVVILQTIKKINDSIPDVVPSNSQIIFKFMNINTFRYSISFKEKQRDIISDEELNKNEFNHVVDPDVYKIIKLDRSDFLLPEITKSSLVDAVNEFERKIRKEKNLLEQKKINISKINNDFDNLIQIKSKKIENEYRDSINSSEVVELLKLEIRYKDSNIILLQNRLEKEQDSIQYISQKIENLKFERDEYLKNNNDAAAYIQTFDKQLFEYLETVAHIDEKVDFYNDLLYLLFSNKDFDKISNLKTELFKKYFNRTPNTVNILYECNFLFTELNREFCSLTKTYNNMNDNSKIKHSYSKLVKYHSSIDKSKYMELFLQIAKLSNEINECNWSIGYQTTAISDKADRISFAFEAIPIKNKFVLTNQQINYNYNFDIKGGFKIDVSAGLFWHFDLMDDKYRFEKLTDTTTSVIKIHNNNEFVPVLGSLFNLYWRSNRHIKPALNFGVGTNVEKIYYYLGGSLLLGKSERIAINGGFVGGSVSRVSDYYRDKLVLNMPIDELPSEVPMQATDAFQIGYYVGISYNLSGKNKKSMESALK